MNGTGKYLGFFLMLDEQIYNWRSYFLFSSVFVSVSSVDYKDKTDESWLVSYLLKALLASEAVRFGPVCVQVFQLPLNFSANTFCSDVWTVDISLTQMKPGQSTCMLACSVVVACSLLLYSLW